MRSDGVLEHEIYQQEPAFGDMCRTVRRFPWLRSEPESLVLYDGVTELQAQTLATLLNRQDMGVTYHAVQTKGQWCDAEGR